MSKDHLSLTMHNFKSGISRYIGWLNEGRYKAIVVCRNKEPVALVTPIIPRRRAAIRIELDGGGLPRHPDDME